MSSTFVPALEALEAPKLRLCELKMPDVRAVFFYCLPQLEKKLL